MRLSEIFSAIKTSALSQTNSPLKLMWRQTDEPVASALLLQRIDITEGLYIGIEGHLTCLPTVADLPLKDFIGLPVGVQLVTDRGNLHTVSGIVTDARAGQSDGGLATYQLTMRDALSILDCRTNTRTFRSKTAVDIIEILFREWRSRSTTLASAVDLDLSRLDETRYPTRRHTQQLNESDAHFIRRICRREGINWFVAAGEKTRPNKRIKTYTTPIHTITFFDDAWHLPEGASGSVLYHRQAATEQRDAITRLTTSQQLIPGAIQRSSWDYKAARSTTIRRKSIVDQGHCGNDLGRLLIDAYIDVPHAGDSYDDFHRQSEARIAAHECGALTMQGTSGVRDLAVGRWIEISEQEDRVTAPKTTQVIITSLHHRAENNLPKELNELAQSLFRANGWHFASLERPDSARQTTWGQSNMASETRYENTFHCVPRRQPIYPHFDPRVHFPRTYPMTAVVVGPPGEEVHCDEMGRVNVQIQGMNADDHAHANGAGTSGTDTDSAPVRIAGALSGARFGAVTMPRTGTEVIVECLNGDPDKMVISGVLHNGIFPPAAFSHVGALPANRYVSGTKTQEIRGKRYNQLRFDDTPAQISSQLASEHAHTQLNLGFLTHPRNGHGEPRGEGAELRSDAAAAVRAAKGILLTTYARHQAAGQQLDRQELVQLLDECSDLFKTLGDYAVEHGGSRTDRQGQHDVAQALRSWSSVAASATESPHDTNAIVAIGAKSGSLCVTPKTHVTYAGENGDQIAQQHLQWMAGKRLNATAGDGVHIFARGSGVQAVAAEGPVTLQARSDAVNIGAQSGVTVSSNDKEVLITAPTIRLVAADGSYIRIGDGITLGTQSDAHIHAASHQWDGPSTEKATHTAFHAAPTDQRFKFHYPTDTADAPPPAHPPYRIELDNERVVEGKADAHGRTSLVKDDAMRIAKIDIVKHKL